MKLEVWRSTANHEERHYFLNKPTRGTYVFGYNPKVIKRKTLSKILAIIKKDL